MIPNCLKKISLLKLDKKGMKYWIDNLGIIAGENFTKIELLDIANRQQTIEKRYVMTELCSNYGYLVVRIALLI